VFPCVVEAEMVSGFHPAFFMPDVAVIRFVCGRSGRILRVLLLLGKFRKNEVIALIKPEQNQPNLIVLSILDAD
jgi:hypothetical protein